MRGGGGGMARSGGGVGGRAGDVTVQVSVPHEYMGRVIGRAGASINEIRTLTGCHIQIAKRDPAETVRLITISGPLEANKWAQSLISMKMVQPQTPASAFMNPYGMQMGFGGSGL